MQIQIYCLVSAKKRGRFDSNTKDLLGLAGQLNNEAVKFILLKESIETTPKGMFTLTIFWAIGLNIVNVIV